MKRSLLMAVQMTGASSNCSSEAEDSGDYTEMTAQDWEDIEREGLALLKARRSA